MKETFPTTGKIEEFEGDYRFLSNFWPSRVTHDGIVYPTVEHAYQAAKTLDFEERRRISALYTPGKAKRAGRALKLRSDWDKVKIRVMRELLIQKFATDTLLREELLNTAPCELIEGNHWNDTFWGVCKGVGTNHLGKLLMEVRRLLRSVEE